MGFNWLRRLIGQPRTGKAQDDMPGWDVLYGYEGAGKWRSADEVFDSFDAAELQAVYSKSELVYACLREITTTLTEPPLRLMQPGPDGQDSAVETHWVLDLLDTPNELDTGDMYLQQKALQWFLTGKGYTWKWRTAGGDIDKLWVPPSSWITVVTGKTGEGEPLIKEFKVKQGTNRDDLPVKPTDMFYARFPDPNSVWGSVGPLQAASRAYQTDEQISNYIHEVLLNADVPGQTIIAPLGFTPAQRAALQSQLHDRAGRGKRGSTIVVEGMDAKIHEQNVLGSLDMPGLEMMTESRICAALGVPPIIIGARAGLEKATYANYETARKSYYRETMVSLWRALEAVLTVGLLRVEGISDLYLEFDLSEIAELQQDATAVATRAVNLIRGGVITRNEARQMAGLGPVPDGNVYIMPLTSDEVPMRTEQEVAEDKRTSRERSQAAPMPPAAVTKKPEDEQQQDKDKDDAA